MNRKEGIRNALAALFSPPMTKGEQRAHWQAVAAQIAKDERARQKSPQLELEASEHA